MPIEKHKIVSPIRAKWNKNHMMPTLSSQQKMHLSTLRNHKLNEKFGEKGYSTSRLDNLSPFSTSRARRGTSKNPTQGINKS